MSYDEKKIIVTLSYRHEHVEQYQPLDYSGDVSPSEALSAATEGSANPLDAPERPAIGCVQICSQLIRRIFNCGRVKTPNHVSSVTSKLLISSIGSLTIIIYQPKFLTLLSFIAMNIAIVCFFLVFFELELGQLQRTPLVIIGSLLIYLLIQIFALTLQPRSSPTISFQVNLA